MYNPEYVRENKTRTTLGFRERNKLPNLGQMTKPHNNQQKRKNLQNCGLCCPGGPQSRAEKYEKKDKYLDLTR